MPDTELTVLLIEGKADHAELIKQHLLRAGGDKVEVYVRDHLSKALPKLTSGGGIGAILVNWQS